ncbi:hypothetical protein NQ315_003047 [Exocentrus adspersus]|uniref:Uncharacterized protein n=1 Tax=Exocentrus adspersus TaxID=1586481 RepID=A0AAV8W4L1_9CUCU|nr:hypothetical protein NQ315_003047 [Exocentrus adspersus]
MLRLFVLLVFSVLVCDGQLIGAPFYPKAIGIGGGGGYLGGGGLGHGGYLGGGGGAAQLGEIGSEGEEEGRSVKDNTLRGHWYPGLSLGGLEGGGLGGAGFVGPKIGGPGIGGPGIGGAGYGGAGIGGHEYGGGIGIGIGAPGLIGGKAIGGEEVERSAFEEGKKNFNNQHFLKSHGQQGGQLHHDNGGFSKGQLAEKNVKSDSGYYSDVNGGKNLYHQGKDYHGGQQYHKEACGCLDFYMNEYVDIDNLASDYRKSEVCGPIRYHAD